MCLFPWAEALAGRFGNRSGHGEVASKCPRRRLRQAVGTKAGRRNRATVGGWLFFREKKRHKPGAEH